jgi:phosphoenolpyruvate-protein kinase (PTS system EI component)
VFVEPDAETLAQVTARQRRLMAYEATLEPFRGLPAITEDGVAVRLEANIGVRTTRTALEGAAGIGLSSIGVPSAGSGPSARRKRPNMPHTVG